MADDNTAALEETLSLVDDCTLVLTNVEEVAALAKYREALEKWTDLLVSVREQHVKTQIKELKTKLQHEEEKIEKEMQKKSDEELEKIKAEIDKMKKMQRETEQQSTKLADDIARLKAEHDEIKTAQEELGKTSDEDKKYNYLVNLHMYVSNIRWQADCPPELVKGYVCNKTNVQPFLLNTTENSPFYVSNYLWSLMEPDW